MSLLQISHVDKQIKLSEKSSIDVLQEINITFPDVGLVGILGKSGCLPVRIATRKAPEKLFCLTPEGNYEEASFRMDGNTVDTPWTLESGEVGVYRLD